LSDGVAQFAAEVAELEATSEDDGQGGARDDAKLAQA
jgi:hypothetical protein